MRVRRRRKAHAADVALARPLRDGLDAGAGENAAHERPPEYGVVDGRPPEAALSRFPLRGEELKGDLWVVGPFIVDVCHRGFWIGRTICVQGHERLQLAPLLRVAEMRTTRADVAANGLDLGRDPRDADGRVAYLADMQRRVHDRPELLLDDSGREPHPAVAAKDVVENHGAVGGEGICKVARVGG